MKAAIIAAGTGERLARGGISVPKPLVRVAGRPLISRAIHAAADLGASSVACVVNDVQPEVARYVRSSAWPLPIELVVKTTPNSMESLFSLAPFLNEEPFLLFTVDAVFRPGVVSGFLERVRGAEGAHGWLALTRFVDDEKPLWVRVDDRHRIVAIGPSAPPTPYVTAGFYYFHPEVFAVVPEARERGLGALREFLGLLVDTGHQLRGVPVPKMIDVDHPEDVEKAEEYLRDPAG